MLGFAKLSGFFALVAIFGSIGLISANAVVQKQGVNDDTECVVCEFLMKEIEQYITTNTTEQEIKDLLEKGCSLLPTTIQDDCNRLIEDYADEIIDLLVQMEDPKTICTQIGVCTSKKSLTFPGPQCELCKLIMGELAKMLSSNATEAEIEAALEKVCSILPSTYAKECDDFVEKYTPTILQLLTHEVAPEAICALIQLCSSKEAPPQVKPEVDDEKCALCEFIMKEVDSLLSDNATEAEIEAALEKVCSILPSTIRQECDTFVQQYLPTLIQLLVNEISPDEVCTLLKFCSSKSVAMKAALLTKAKLVAPKRVAPKQVSPKQVAAKQVAAKQVAADDNCALCEFVMKEVDSLLSENSTEEEITKVIENICNILPGTLKEQCDSFLDTYGPVLITLLVQQMDPKTICTAIGLCSKSPKVYTFIPSDGPVTPNQTVCAFCEFIMAELKDLISKNSTEEEIKKALGQVCSILPSQFKDACVVFVHKYSDAIIQLLVNDIDPTQICTAIGFCKSTVATSDDECDLCQLLVKFADDFIRSNSTEEEIVKGLLDVCSILPSNLKDQCTNIVNQYGTIIPALIAELLSPLKVCEVLGICSQEKLGAKLCSRGPAVWCASLENAKLCNAVVHCQRHVWN